jgi:protoporphyrinogen oxidase
VVLEASDTVGGISRTVERDGWRFDIGGHRFFTKVPEVEALWHEILPTRSSCCARG